MSEEKKAKKWYGWAKNLISAIAGAVISCAATFGIIGTDDAEVAKQKIDSWMQKTDVVYAQVETVGNTIAEVKQLIADKKYIEALGKLDTIKDSAMTTVITVKELRDEISEAAKAVADEAKEKVDEVKGKVDEVKDTIKDAINDVKEADGNNPVEETSAE